MAGTGLQLAIIADDLTGALDAAAPFARRGLNVRVLTSPDCLNSVSTDLPQILAINTGTRHAEAAMAATVVRNLVVELAQLQPERLFKKIDSTMRGHVVVETVAVIQATEYHEVLICPAVPTQGRTMTGGEIFINSIPLRRTAIGLDLRSQPPLAPLPELFQAALPEVPVTLETAADRLLTDVQWERQHIRIADAVNDAQLLSLAGAVVGQGANTLFVGAAGMSEALAETLFGQALPVTVPAALPGMALFVVGSRAPQALTQVRTLAAAHPATQVTELADSQPLDNWALQPLASRVLMAPQTSLGIDPDLVAEGLADSAVSLLQQAEIGLLLVTGGDTALAVLNALDVSTIRVCGEIEPGIVHGLIDTRNGPLRLVTKAGGFGDSQLFCTIENYFR